MNNLKKLVIAVITMSFCSGAAKAADEVTMMLNWFPAADHSALYLAREKGYYEDEGLDLEIRRGQGSSDAVAKIDLQQAEFGMADIPTILTAISKGADVVIVGIVYDKAANNVFFRKSSGIETVADLAGLKIATTPADSHRTLWPVLAAANDVEEDSVTLVNVKPEGKHAILVADRVDAVFDLYTGLPAFEKVIGKGEVGNLLFADNGVQLYGHGYFVHKDTIANNPEMVRGFLRATYKGWADAYVDKEGAIDAVGKVVDGIRKEVYLEQLDIGLNLIITERSREFGLGWIVPESMASTIEIARTGGKFGDTPVVLEDVYTNEFNSKIQVLD